MIIYLLLLYSDIIHYLHHISRQSSHYHYPGRIFHFIYQGVGGEARNSPASRRLKQDLYNTLKIEWMSVGFISPPE